VARLMSYDTIPSTLPADNALGYLTEEQKQREHLRGLNTALGLSETINYSFISPKEAERMLTAEDHPWRRPLAIANPLTEEQSVMRLSLLPGLLNCAHRNISRRNLDLALFELDSVYLPIEEDPAAAQPLEAARWALLLTGHAPACWQGPGRAYDYFYAKGLLETVAAAFHSGPLRFECAPAAAYPYLHPGRSALVLLDGTALGVLGELHPQVADHYDLPRATVVAEIRTDTLFQAARLAAPAGLPRYPALERDIALVGSTDIAAAKIEAAIRQAGEPLLAEIRLFDMYVGPPIAAGQRSLAYALSFRHEERTLTDAEADAAVDRILQSLYALYGLKLR